MRTTIDAAGRIVVPKRLRDELGFGPGQELELSAVDGRLEVESPLTPGCRGPAIPLRAMPATT